MAPRRQEYETRQGRVHLIRWLRRGEKNPPKEKREWKKRPGMAAASHVRLLWRVQVQHSIQGVGKQDGRLMRVSMSLAAPPTRRPRGKAGLPVFGDGFWCIGERERARRGADGCPDERRGVRQSSGLRQQCDPGPRTRCPRRRGSGTREQTSVTPSKVFHRSGPPPTSRLRERCS